MLLLDEPTSALDEISRLKVESRLKNIHFIWITHDPSQEERINAEFRLTIHHGGDYIFESIQKGTILPQIR